MTTPINYQHHIEYHTVPTIAREKIGDLQSNDEQARLNHWLLTREIHDVYMKLFPDHQVTSSLNPTEIARSFIKYEWERPISTRKM